MTRLLSLFVALVVVLLGLGSALSNSESASTRRAPTSRSDIAPAAAVVQQASDVSDPDQRCDPPAPPGESDDDDCDEQGAASSRFSFEVPFPPSSLDAPQPGGIGPSQGHRTGPEKPPRA